MAIMISGAIRWKMLREVREVPFAEQIETVFIVFRAIQPMQGRLTGFAYG
jgi:hypothetical protein